MRPIHSETIVLAIQDALPEHTPNQPPMAAHWYDLKTTSHRTSVSGDVFRETVLIAFKPSIYQSTDLDAGALAAFGTLPLFKSTK